MKSMIKDALILFAITLVAGLSLGFVNEVTKEPIAKAKEQAKQEVCQEVFQDASGFSLIEGFSTEEAAVVLAQEGVVGSDITEVYTATDASDVALGYVIIVTNHEGYAGDIQFSMGVTLDGTLNGISLLSISETPGLGMEAGEVLVPQFAGKQVRAFTYTKSGATEDSQIDAISGATVTTNAIVNGVNAGLVYYQTALEGGSVNE